MMNLEKIILVSALAKSSDDVSILWFILYLVIFILTMKLLETLKESNKIANKILEDNKVDTNFTSIKKEVEYKTIKEIRKEEKEKKVDENYEKTKKDLGID